MWGSDLRNINVFSRWRKTVKEGDDWMSSGREFQRTDAATGNERRPTVDRRNDGTRSEWVDDDRSRRRPGRSAIRVSWLRYGGARPRSTRYDICRNLHQSYPWVHFHDLTNPTHQLCHINWVNRPDIYNPFQTKKSGPTQPNVTYN